MNSKVVKCVAGSGKTTLSRQILDNNKNGLYIAYTNSVVDSISVKGHLARTIDSLFSSFIIPKFIGIMPIISNNADIKYFNANNAQKSLLGIANIHLDPKTGILYHLAKKHKKDTAFNLRIPNALLYMPQFANKPNAKFVKAIFGREKLLMTDSMRNELSLYIINHWPNLVIKIIRDRFSFVIIDEAQDLNKHKEEFAKILYESCELPIIMLGDDNQNIVGGGSWFEKLKPDEVNDKSYRCPEENCKWIRNNLSITIYGDEAKTGNFFPIQYSDVLSLDDTKRTLLYVSASGKRNKDILEKWDGPKSTIKSAKGKTIPNDIVIIGDKINTKNLYTAITRTEANVYCTATPSR